MNESDQVSESLDPGLEALFRRAQSQWSDETFVAATMRRVNAAKVQRRLGRRLAEAGVLIAVVAASPWFIAASVKLSSLIEAGIEIVSGWLATPAGLTLIVAIVAAGAASRPLVNRLASRTSARDDGRRGNRDPG